MLINLHKLVRKYNINLKGILHVGAHECEELSDYLYYLPVNKILWVEAMKDKVDMIKQVSNNAILIEHAVVSDKIEKVKFNVSNNGQSSSFLDFGLHEKNHPHVWYVDSFETETKLLKDIVCKYDIDFNFINLDIQGVELKALKGMEDYLNNISYIYTEVNDDYVYKNCALVGEIDEYLKEFGFERVETQWCSDYKWGDAFYIKKT
jgi:FkbM family methyltransferase